MLDLVRTTGNVIFRVFDEHQKIKQLVEVHNIITKQGDALIADIVSGTNARQKLDNTHGYIVVGTGYTGTNIKNQEWVMTQTGSPQAMASTYPKLSAAWGLTGENIVIYQVLFPQASLNVTGINEAALVTGSTQISSTSCLAYAQVTPSVNVSPSDTLQVTWQITFLGA